MYVYLKMIEEKVWTVGFYKPSGEWVPESDHLKEEDAVVRVHYLNADLYRTIAEKALFDKRILQCQLAFGGRS